MRGKYSPMCPNSNLGFSEFKYNAKGNIPLPYVSNENYIEELQFPNYDSEGFDSYGYSAYDSNGNYVGVGNGVDRLGNTENDYINNFDDESFNLLG